MERTLLIHPFVHLSITMGWKNDQDHNQMDNDLHSLTPNTEKLKYSMIYRSICQPFGARGKRPFPVIDSLERIPAHLFDRRAKGSRLNPERAFIVALKNLNHAQSKGQLPFSVSSVIISQQSFKPKPFQGNMKIGEGEYHFLQFAILLNTPTLRIKHDNLHASSRFNPKTL